MAPSILKEGMKEDGLAIKKSLLPDEQMAQMLEDADEEDPEVQFLKSLTQKQKKKLLK